MFSKNSHNIKRRIVFETTLLKQQHPLERVLRSEYFRFHRPIKKKHR